MFAQFVQCAPEEAASRDRPPTEDVEIHSVPSSCNQEKPLTSGAAKSRGACLVERRIVVMLVLQASALQASGVTPVSAAFRAFVGVSCKKSRRLFC